MSTRLQVVMEDGELAEIRRAAERRRMTVSAWVRQVLRAERSRELRGATGTVREPSAKYGEAVSPRERLDIEVKSSLIEAVQQRYHLATPRAAVEYALRRLSVQPMSRDEALAMQGEGWAGDLDEMRSGDPGETL